VIVDRGGAREAGDIMLTEGSYEPRIAGVRRYLEARFDGSPSMPSWWSCEPLSGDEDSIHAYVVYEENGETLNLR